MKRWLGLGCLIALSPLACGGRSAPAEVPSKGAPEPQQQEYPGSTHVQDEQPGGGGQFAQPPPGAGSESWDLDQALSVLESSASALAGGASCELSCKALGSMRRAAARICELNGSDDPGGRCESARQRVKRAAESVERSCGECEE